MDAKIAARLCRNDHLCDCVTCSPPVLDSGRVARKIINPAGTCAGEICIYGLGLWKVAFLGALPTLLPQTAWNVPVCVDYLTPRGVLDPLVPLKHEPASLQQILSSALAFDRLFTRRGRRSRGI